MRFGLILTWCALLALPASAGQGDEPAIPGQPGSPAPGQPGSQPISPASSPPGGGAPGHVAERLPDPASTPAAAAVVPGLDERTRREIAELGHGALIEGESRAGGDDVREHHVAFTFDDGPKHTTTPRVLDALDRYDVPATFFVVGWRFAGKNRQAQRNAEVLADVVARGHLVGNHTFRHRNLATLTPELMRKEIDQNTQALSEALGYTPHTFRPPYGAMSKRARAHVRSEGLTEVRWGIDTSDFRPELARTLRKRTIEKIIRERGGVVLMHDTKEATAKNVALILDDLERENCRRLAAREPLILPVSLHYFMLNRDGSPRPVPPEVEARTQRYRDGLPGRCAARAAPETKPTKPAARAAPPASR